MTTCQISLHLIYGIYTHEKHIYADITPFLHLPTAGFLLKFDRRLQFLSKNTCQIPSIFICFICCVYIHAHIDIVIKLLLLDVRSSKEARTYFHVSCLLLKNNFEKIIIIFVHDFLKIIRTSVKLHFLHQSRRSSKGENTLFTKQAVDACAS